MSDSSTKAFSYRRTPQWVLASGCFFAICINPLLQNLRISVYRDRIVNLESAQPNAVQGFDKDNNEPVRDDIGTADFTSPPNLTNQSNQGPKIALFYNVYWNPRNTSLAADIIAEQLQQRRGQSIQYVDLNETGSDVVILEEDNQQNGAPDSTLYYFSLGATNHTMPPCDPCHHLGHRKKGFEEFTLQAMYEYCAKRPQDTVVYFHNKGSMNSNAMNDRLRRHLTKAIFTRECLHIHNTSYDLCAATITGFPFAHTPGNFFTAKCKYVNRLIPPKDFERVKREVHVSMMQNKSLSWVNDTNVRMSRESWLGLDRYAMEHWIGSHPSMNPGIVYPRFQGQLTYDSARKDLSWAPKLRRKFSKARRLMKNAPDFYKRAGRLYLYEKLYGEIPPPDSWVWWYYST